MMSRLEDLSAHALARDPARRAIEFEQRWYNWGEMRAVADHVDALMAATGAASQAPVAFIARNRPSAATTLLALIRQARHIRIVYAFQSPAGIARNLDQLKPAVVVLMAEDESEEMRSILRDRGIAGIVLDRMGARPLEGCERSSAAWSEPPAGPEIQILTSGTTGPPKQFTISYELMANDMVGANIFVSAQSADASTAPPFLYFPIGNISGLYSTLPSLMHGVPVVLADRFSLQGWHDYILRHRPVALGVPPAGVQMVLDAGIPPEDLASVRWITTGAAPLDPAVHRAFEARYGIPILLSYGATEFAGPAVIMTPDLYPEWGEKKFGTAGRPLPGIQLRVIDPETEAVLPASCEGLLEVIVPRIGPDWIRTSDIVVVDEDGFMFHKGRADGAIIRGGFKILPETIECALLLHDAISAAGVVGIPDKRLGQVPAAVVQLRPGVPRPSEGELERHLREHVLATHLPTAWRFVDELPKNPSFKIDRSALRALFVD